MVIRGRDTPALNGCQQSQRSHRYGVFAQLCQQDNRGWLKRFHYKTGECLADSSPQRFANERQPTAQHNSVGMKQVYDVRQPKRNYRSDLFDKHPGDWVTLLVSFVQKRSRAAKSVRITQRSLLISLD